VTLQCEDPEGLHHGYPNVDQAFEIATARRGGVRKILVVSP
jgi:hypothetical protein